MDIVVKTNPQRVHLNIFKLTLGAISFNLVIGGRIAFGDVLSASDGVFQLALFVDLHYLEVLSVAGFDFQSLSAELYLNVMGL